MAAVENPGRIPMTWERIQRDVMRCALDPDIAPVELAICGQIARLLMEHTGELDNVTADVRKAALEEAEQAERERFDRITGGHAGRMLLPRRERT